MGLFLKAVVVNAYLRTTLSVMDVLLLGKAIILYGIKNNMLCRLLQGTGITVHKPHPFSGHTCT